MPIPAFPQRKDHQLTALAFRKYLFACLPFFEPGLIGSDYCKFSMNKNLC